MTHRPATRLYASLLFLLSVVTCSTISFGGDWPQAAGPNSNFVMSGQAATDFSVTLNRKVLWQSPLPSTGQGTPVVSGGRVFVTSHEPISSDTEFGSTILGLCFDAQTGRELWRRELPGVRVTDLSSLFSDNTAASPVAHNGRVCFSNVGGSTKCFDFDGNELWSQSWTPFGRHHARMHEPILFGNQVILLRTLHDDLPVEATTKPGAQSFGRGRELWTHLQSFDLATGERQWIAESATSVHSTSLLSQTSNGRWAILTGRGGGHQPPEEPYGLSLLDASTGETIWDKAINGYPAAQNASWNAQMACFCTGTEHRTIDIESGEQRSASSLTSGVTVCRFEDGKYTRHTDQRLPKLKKAITNQSNCLVGDYHYFLAHDDYLIGRVNVRSGAVEYIQVPVQVVRQPDQPEERLWQKALPNDMKNADGFVATQDRRNAGSGWGHVSAASPIVVGDYIYMPTMVGMVYCLKWNSERLDQQALASISDLGPATATWSLSSLSCSNGRLFARTLKELICIGTE